MGQTADELKIDIERRRESLSGTVDAIEDRVLPGRIIERRRQAVRGRLNSARDRVMGTRDEVTGRISDVASDAASTMRGATEVPERLADQTRGAPLIAVIPTAEARPAGGAFRSRRYAGRSYGSTVLRGRSLQ